jgi:hypothetical protein
MKTLWHAPAVDAGRATTQVRGSLARCFKIALAAPLFGLARWITANKPIDLTPSEIERRYQLFLECGF